MLEQELQKLGLSDKEARVYLAALQMGKSPVQDIAHQSKVNRGTAYNIIEALMKKGLVSSYQQGKKTFFVAESPDRLISLLRIQEQEIREKEREFSRHLPDLLDMYGSADNKPKVKYYEGVEGLNAVKEEYLRIKNKVILNISCLDSVINIFPNLWEDYTPRRVKSRIRSKMIYTTKEKSIKIDSDNAKLRETKYINFKAFPFQSDLSIFDDKISFLLLEDKPSAVVIQDEKMANSMKIIFYKLWKDLSN